MEAPGIDGQSPKVITSCIWSYISCALWRSRRNFRRKVIALQSKPFSSTQSVSFGKSSLAWSWSPRIVGGTNRARLAQGANPAIQEIVQFGHLKHPTILNNFKSEFIYTAITTCVTLKHHSGLCLCWPVKTCIEPCAANDFQSEKASRWFQFHVSRSRWCPDLWDELRVWFWTEKRTMIVKKIIHWSCWTTKQTSWPLLLLLWFLAFRNPKKLISPTANCCFALLFWDSYE